MDLTLNPEEAQLQEGIAQLLSAEVTPTFVRSVESDGSRDQLDGLWRRLAELGYLGITVPESLGGAGGTPSDLVLVLEQAGRFACPGPVVDTAVSAAILGEIDAQRDAVAAAVQGRSLFCVGWSEPEADALASLGLRRSHDGRLSGTKISLNYAAWARQMIAFAESAVYCVDLDSPEVKRVERRTLGEDHACDVELKRYAPAESGVLTTDPACVRRWRDLYFTSVAAFAVGLCDRATELSLEFARQREQFGQPIGSYQAIQHRCVDMSLATEGARYLVYQAAFQLSQGRDASAAAAMAQSYSAGAIERVCRHAHQIHGAIGFTRELDLQLYTRRAKHLQVQLGGRSGRADEIASAMGLHA